MKQSHRRNWHVRSWHLGAMTLMRAFFANYGCRVCSPPLLAAPHSGSLDFCYRPFSGIRLPMVGLSG